MDICNDEQCEVSKIEKRHRKEHSEKIFNIRAMSGQLVQWKSSPDRVTQSAIKEALHSPLADGDMNEMNVPVDPLENKVNSTNIIEGSPKANPNPVKFLNTS